MIPEKDVEDAVDFLRTSAKDAAQARADVKYIAEFLKTKRAQLKVALTSAPSDAAAETRALADPAYLEVLEGYREAVRRDALHSFKREAAAAMIDAWRTQQSNARELGRLG